MGPVNPQTGLSLGDDEPPAVPPSTPVAAPQGDDFATRADANQQRQASIGGDQQSLAGALLDPGPSGSGQYPEYQYANIELAPEYGPGQYKPIARDGAAGGGSGSSAEVAGGPAPGPSASGSASDTRGSPPAPDLAPTTLPTPSFWLPMGRPDSTDPVDVDHRQRMRSMIMGRFGNVDVGPYSRTMNLGFTEPNTTERDAVILMQDEHAELLLSTLDKVHRELTGVGISADGLQNYLSYCERVASSRHAGEGLLVGETGFGGSGLFGGAGAVAATLPAWAMNGSALAMSFAKVAGQALGQGLISPGPVATNIEAAIETRRQFDSEHRIHAVRQVRPANQEKGLNARRLLGFSAAALSVAAVAPSVMLLRDPDNQGLRADAEKAFYASIGLAFGLPALVSSAGWGIYNWLQSNDAWLVTGPVKRVNRPVDNTVPHFEIDEGAVRTQLENIYQRGPETQAARDILHLSGRLMNPCQAMEHTPTSTATDRQKSNESFLRGIQGRPIGVAAVAGGLVGLFGGLATSSFLLGAGVGLVTYNTLQPAFWSWNVCTDRAFAESRSIATAAPVDVATAQPAPAPPAVASGEPPGSWPHPPLGKAPAPSWGGQAALAGANLFSLCLSPFVANLHQTSVSLGPRICRAWDAIRPARPAPTGRANAGVALGVGA